MEKRAIKYINITGNIGVGTTTLHKKLCEHFNWQPSNSQAHLSPYLKDFYKNKGKSAFHNQIHIIIQSLQRQTKLDFATTICQDYTIFEHNDVYSKVMLDFGFIQKHEFTLLTDLFETCSQNLKRPDLLIYLHTDIDTLLKRIMHRNRAEEGNIEGKYLTKLQQRFDEFAQ